MKFLYVLVLAFLAIGCTGTIEVQFDASLDDAGNDAGNDAGHDDGQVDDWFEPNEWECWMYELVNLTRAAHDDEGAPECHKPLNWDVEWSAHGRNHSIKMKARNDLFHADFPMAQNVAYGCDPPCEMDMYMTGWDEPHCPDLSHHCNILRCSIDSIGIGYEGNWNTQNFY